jgi:hypothetical protein
MYITSLFSSKKHQYFHFFGISKTLTTDKWAVDIIMGLARIERAAYRLGGDRSIQLSYSPNFVLL